MTIRDLLHGLRFYEPYHVLRLGVYWLYDMINI